MPFGFFAAFTGVAVFPGFGGCNAQVTHFAAIPEGPDLGVAAEVSDEHYFVQ
jgi:hypothetical protein